MVLLALRACSLSEAGSALRAPHCASLVWCYLHCVRVASPRLLKECFFNTNTLPSPHSLSGFSANCSPHFAQLTKNLQKYNFFAYIIPYLCAKVHFCCKRLGDRGLGGGARPGGRAGRPPRPSATPPERRGMSRDRCCLREGWGGALRQCVEDWLGGVGEVGEGDETLFFGRAWKSGLGVGEVGGNEGCPSPLPRPTGTSNQRGIAGEGCTVFPQTLTTPRHSPPSRRGARRAGWCLPRRRQAAATNTRQAPATLVRHRPPRSARQ